MGLLQLHTVCVESMTRRNKLELLNEVMRRGNTGTGMPDRPRSSRTIAESKRSPPTSGGRRLKTYWKRVQELWSYRADRYLMLVLLWRLYILWAAGGNLLDVHREGKKVYNAPAAVLQSI